MAGKNISIMIATDNDHRIIDAVSFALHGKIGRPDDIDRLYKEIVAGGDEGKWCACQIAVAFIRWAQDLKERIKDE